MFGGTEAEPESCLSLQSPSLGSAFQYIDVAALHHQAPPQAFSQSVNVLHYEWSDITSLSVTLLRPRGSRGSSSTLPCTRLFLFVPSASVLTTPASHWVDGRDDESHSL